MTFQNKSTSQETFDDVDAIVLNGMAESKTELVTTDGYEAMAVDDPKTAGYYIVCFVSSAYTLQEEYTSEEEDTFEVGELIVDAVYAYPICKKGPKVPQPTKAI